MAPNEVLSLHLALFRAIVAPNECISHSPALILPVLAPLRTDSDASGLPGLTPERLFGFLLEKFKGTLTFPSQKSLSTIPDAREFRGFDLRARHSRDTV
ncbi:MAG: hypothetical protein IKS71_07125, partial [Bacteroidales bacterium]|nr:hypothetical protein [Bacteroidales bacterium]